MRPNNQSKNRSRGRSGGRKHTNPLSRNYESNGPDVKIRGNAAHVADKYVQLARDAQASGDSVMAENYFQHAEHYFRIISAAQAQMSPRSEASSDDDHASEDASEKKAGEEAAASSENAGAEAKSTGEAAGGDKGGDAGEDKPRTRRPRRRKVSETAQQADAQGEDAPSSKGRKDSKKGDPAQSEQPDVGELPAFLTGTSATRAAE